MKISRIKEREGKNKTGKAINSYRRKALHGEFVRGTENIRDSESCNWLKRGTMKKEMEGLLTAAQDQSLCTNYINNKIDKLDVLPTCRMCGEREEIVSHITVECK